MRNTRPDAFLTREILGYVRDERPAPEAFVARFGEPCFHLLRKAAVIVMDGERLALSPRHLSSDGRHFLWGTKVIHLDQDRIDFVRRGPRRPPGSGERS